MENENKVNAELQKFSPLEAGIAQMESDFMKLKIINFEDKDNYKLVKDARLTVKGKRVEVEKTRKLLVADALKFQKSVNDKAKEITAKLEPIEEYLESQEKEFEAEKERIKMEKEKQEQERISQRIHRLTDAGMIFDGKSYYIGELEIGALFITNAIDSQFDDIVNKAIAEKTKIEEQMKLKVSRTKELLKYGFQYEFDDLGVISNEEYNSILTEKKDAYEAKIKAQEEEKQAMIKRQQEQEAEAKRQEEENNKLKLAQEKLDKEREDFINERSKQRQANIVLMGFVYNKETYSFVYPKGPSITSEFVRNASESEFLNVVDEGKKEISQLKEIEALQQEITKKLEYREQELIKLGLVKDALNLQFIKDSFNVPMNGLAEMSDDSFNSLINIVTEVLSKSIEEVNPESNVPAEIIKESDNVEREIEKYNNLSSIVAQLEKCNYECEEGFLVNNVAFISLKRMAQFEI